MTDRPTAITGAWLLDGSSPEPRRGTLHLSDGVITGVDTTPDAAVPDGSDVVDATGRTVVPGLIDAHFHAYAAELDALRIDSYPLSYVALKAGRRLGSALRRGFTTVRDVAGGDFGLRRAAQDGHFAAPDYLYTGRALSQTGGHGDGRLPDRDLCAGHQHMGEVVDGADNLRVAVRERLRTGAHAIKIMASGGVASHCDPLRIPQYSLEEIAAVCEEASRRGSYVAAHAYTAEAVTRAVQQGVRSVEHGNLIDAATAAVMAEHGAYLVPTLIAYDAMDRRADEVGMTEDGRAKNTMVLGAGKEAVALAEAAGVSIGFGTDLMGDLEDDQLIGLRLQAEVQGVWGTLRSATAVNAELLRLEDRGFLAVGQRADLLVLDGDLTADESLLWDGSRARTVIQQGRVVPAAVGAGAA